MTNGAGHLVVDNGLNLVAIRIHVTLPTAQVAVFLFEVFSDVCSMIEIDGMCLPIRPAAKIGVIFLKAVKRLLMACLTLFCCECRQSRPAVMLAMARAASDPTSEMRGNRANRSLLEFRQMPFGYRAEYGGIQPVR
jgi:hypothetical protein